MIAAEKEVRWNRIVAALPATALARWLRELEPVDLSLGQHLYESSARLSHAYFPTTAIVSLQCVTAKGGSVHLALVGHDGMVGLPLFMGGEVTTSQAVVQHPGKAYRITSEMIRNEFEQPAVAHILLRYAQALITQIAQTAACNRHHCIDQQLCSWLLQTSDRLEGRELEMTHEAIANTLGVRRESVTESARRLQFTGMIHYARGHITVLDRGGLERRVCECYAVVKRETDRLLPEPALC